MVNSEQTKLFVITTKKAEFFKCLTLFSQALKSAERKTKETLKEVAMAATINKTRKTYW